MALAVVKITVDGEQHLGRDLAEAVDDALYPEIGRARRPDGPAARRGQHGDRRLGHVGKVAGHAIAGCKTERRERLSKARNGIVHLAPAQRAAHLVLAPEDHRRSAILPAQQVFGEVEPGLGEEARAGKFAAVGQSRAAAHLADHAAEAPHLAPELLRFGDRPAPQRAVIGELDPVRPFDPAHEGGEIGGFNARLRRLPQGLVAGGRLDGGRHERSPRAITIAVRAPVSADGRVAASGRGAI